MDKNTILFQISGKSGSFNTFIPSTGHNATLIPDLLDPLTPSAFKDLVNTYQRQVLNTALGFLRQREEAEDMCQEVFLEVHESWGRFNGQSAVSTWIYRITVNKCLDRLRAGKRKKRLGFLTALFHPESGEVLHEVSHSDHPGIVLEKKEQAAYLFRAIDRLGESQKTAFVLAHLEDLSHKEIASIMQTTPKAVESLVQRAKLNLRKELEKMYPGRGI